MSGNDIGATVFLNVTDLKVTGDTSPGAGTPTEVTVSFEFAQPFYNVIWLPNNWPFTIKIYAEGFAGKPEFTTEQKGNCNQADPHYEVKVPWQSSVEGVYLISAIVELDTNAGWAMGWSDVEPRITVWTAV